HHDRRTLELMDAVQGSHVVRHRLEAHRPVGGGRSPMRLEIDPDDPTTGGEELHVGTEHLHGSKTAVQEEERLTFTEHLVAELDPVDLGNLGSIHRHRPLSIWAVTG